MKRGWIFTGSGPDLGMIEVLGKVDEVVSYSYLKEVALHNLKEEMQCLKDQIEKIDSDEYLKTGRLPPCAAWMNEEQRLIVVAASKDRAKQLIGCSRQAFRKDWSQCEGVWWYQYAAEEGFLREVIGDDGIGIGVYLRAPKPDPLIANTVRD